MPSDNYMDMDELSSSILAHLVVSSLPPATENSKAKKETKPKADMKKSKEQKSKKDTRSKPAKEAPSSEAATTTTKKEVAPYDRWNLLDPSSIDYGFCAQNPAKPPPEYYAKGGFYLTTAINYTNGPAHMGHAYEATTSDVLVRFARVRGGEGYEAVYFLTGSDEHGEKIAKTAEKEEKKPIEICDKYVTGFQCLNQRMRVTNDDYMRTTSSRHKKTAQQLWKKCAEAGDIYLDTYSGWYNVREEAFVTDSDAALSDYKDPTSGLPLQKVEESSYFFKMSKYHDKLVEHITNCPDFIRPDFQRNGILSRLKGDKLRDLSISRTTFDWGVPVPEGFESNHVMYVWIDALSNYLTGVDALELKDFEHPENLHKMWPANVHIIGKDILWFHTVIWPCILMSAGVPLPKTVFAHGFVNDKEGKKMSKSMGNVVDPHDMLDKYPVDTFRWYLCKEAPYGGELSFSEESLAAMHNADLCDTLGNLMHRATNLCQKHCSGVVPDVDPPADLPFDFEAVRKNYIEKMDNFELEGGANIAMQGFRDVNGYLTEKAPWHMKGDELATARQIVVRATLEAVYALAHLLVPFLPVGCKDMFGKLNTEPKKLVDLDCKLRNLTVGTKIDVGGVLYEKILSDEELSRAEAAKKKASEYAEAQKRKKEKKQQEIAKSKAGQAGSSSDQAEFTKLDIRVGRITKAWHHENADKLFCEEIDVGEEGGPRQIASGLREHYTLEEFNGKMVLVVCNLKAAKIVGFTSNGMVLAAKGESKVELVEPPEGSKVGERVFIEGLEGEPFSSSQVKKKKIWEGVSKDLKTNDGAVATWDGKPIATSAGPCKAASLCGAPVS